MAPFPPRLVGRIGHQPTTPVVRLPRGLRAVLVRFGLLAVAFGMGSLAAQTCFAQGALGPPAQNPPEADPAEEGEQAAEDLHSLYYSAHLPTDRRLERDLEQARHLFAEQRYSEGIPLVDRVLATPQDAFRLSDARQSAEVATGLKSSAKQLLSELPPEGIAAVELDLGAKGRRQLRQAIRSGELSAIAEVAKRYPLTSAAAEASSIVAQAEIDRGHYEAAARLYDDLARSPTASPELRALALVRSTVCYAASPDSPAFSNASQTLLATQDPAVLKEVRRLIGSREVASWVTSLEGTSSERITTTAGENWLMEGGGARRNPTSAATMPHAWPTWKTRIVHRSHLARQLEQRRHWQQENQTAWLPVSSPLAVGNLVITRSPENIVAVDWQTGQRLWDTRPAPLETTGRPFTLAANSQQGTTAVSLDTLEQRVWLDGIYGDLSSDGSRVFAIRNLTSPQSQGYSPWRIQGFGRNGVKLPGQVNALSAYELRTEGKLVWEVNGAGSGELAGVFFLGSPLAIDDTLYVIAELRNSVQLVALEAATGKLKWKQWLVNLERSVQFDIGRRLAGATPTLSHGLLLCPTGAGSVVAIDRFDRSLKWSYRYEVDESVASRSAVGWHQHVGAYEAGLTDRWRRNRCIAAGSTVLITAPESIHLHAVDIISGEKLWTVARGDHQFVAGVSGDRVALVSPQAVDFVSLSSGGPAGSEPTIDMPAGTTVVGLGVLAPDRLLLPISNNHIASIRISTGQLDSLLPVRTEGCMGNLAFHRGTLLSQSTTAIARFDQFASLEQRAESQLPEAQATPDTLRIRGEIAWSGGDLAEATRLFLAARKQLPTDPTIRARLSEALLTGLSSNYAENKGHFELLESLLDDSSQQIELRRLHVDAALSADDYATAFESLMSLQRVDQPTLISRVDGSSVLAERWFAGRLLKVWQNADEGLKSQISNAINSLHSSGGGQVDLDSTGRMTHYFGAVPPGRTLRTVYATSLFEAGRAAEAEIALLQTDPQERVAQLGSLPAEYRNQFSYWEESAPRAKSQFPQQLAYTAWPDGKVAVEHYSGRARGVASDSSGSRSNAKGVFHRLLPTTHVGVPWTGSVDLTLTEGGGQVLGWNRWGELQQFTTVGFELSRSGNPSTNHKTIRFGRFCVFGTGRSVATIDLVANTTDAPEPLLWASRQVNQSYLSRRQLAGWQGQNRSTFRTEAASAEDHTGELCTAGPFGVVLRDGDRVRCFDPISGELVWQQTGVPSSGATFGDWQHVFLLDSQQRSGLVLSMIDGSKVGECEFPEGKIIAIAGRNLTTSRYRNGKRVIEIVDMLTGEMLQQRTYESGTKFSEAIDGKLACHERSGRFEWLDLLSGKLLFEQQLLPDRKLEEIRVIPSGELMFLATNRRTQAQHNTDGFEPAGDAPVVTGRIYALDASSGELAWQRPATVEGQGLANLQPSGSPVLAFVTRAVERRNNQTNESTKLLLLDKRTGRSLYRSDDFRPVGNAAWSMRVDTGTQPQVTLQLPYNTVELQFTNTPRPPEPVALANVEGEQKKASDGLWNLGRRLFGASLTPEPSPAERVDD